MHGSRGEMTGDMAKRGFSVLVIKHLDSLLEQIQKFTWCTRRRPGNRERVGKVASYMEKPQVFRRQDSARL